MVKIIAINQDKPIVLSDHRDFEFNPFAVSSGTIEMRDNSDCEVSYAA